MEERIQVLLGVNFIQCLCVEGLFKKKNTKLQKQKLVDRSWKGLIQGKGPLLKFQNSQ